MAEIRPWPAGNVRSLALEWQLLGEPSGRSGSRADIQTAGLPPTGALAQKQRARVAFVVGPFEGGHGTSLILKQGTPLLVIRQAARG